MEAQPWNLPHEMELDILRRLPVKSLLRFKAVCKPWRSLINHPNFVDMHLHRTNDGHHLNRWRIGYAKFSSDQPPSVSLYSTDLKGCDKQVSVLFVGEKNIWGAQILCCCNGLLLMRPRDSLDLFLWNPSTREYNKFSAPNFSKDCLTFWGIGYDSSSDDYKVIRAVRVWRSTQGCVELFSLKTNSWTEIIMDDFPWSPSSLSVANVNVNGSPHWLGTRHDPRRDPGFREVIIYFDFREEKFKEIPQPTRWFKADPLKYTPLKLGVMGGCLCVVREHKRGYSEATYFEAWAMKEYGVQESWTKLFAIKQWFTYLKPYRFTKNGEVLMEVDRNKFVIYNLKEDSYTIFMPQDNKWPFSVDIYVESLVSPGLRKGPRQ